MSKVDKARCWLYDVSELYDSQTFAKAMDRLPWESRRKKVMRYRFEKDRCLCLGAGLLAAHALRCAGESDLRMTLGEHGKPCLERGDGTHFNLSHSGTLAVCAVSSAAVGVDVEEPHSYDDSVARICFSEAERHWICSQNNKDESFTRMWVRKESYLKLTGTGLCDKLTAIDVVPTSSDPLAAFWETTCDGYSISVCSRERLDIALQQAAPRFWMMSENGVPQGDTPPAVHCGQCTAGGVSPCGTPPSRLL